MSKVLKVEFDKIIRANLRPDMFVYEISTERMKRFAQEYTYIILGEPGPTGKTRLTNELINRGFDAFEITADILGLVSYNDNKNHYMVDHYAEQVVIVLNDKTMFG